MPREPKPEIDRVEVDDEFWSPRQRTNEEVTLNIVHQQLVESGRFENLQHAIEGVRGDQQLALENRMYRDESDIYKWLEAASYALASGLDPDLEAKVEDAISLLEDAQCEDGYLNAYFSLYAPEDRWSNLGMMHELYSAGHLFEAAVAHHEATGSTQLLNIATALADHIHEELSGRSAAPGHQEIEIGLVKLYRTTGEKRYLDLAKQFLDERGKPDSRFRWELEHLETIPGTESIKETYRRLFLENGTYDGRYVQDHAPVREQSEAVGHAVRAVYMYSAMADVAMETGDEELIAALERIWESAVDRRMYVTGGLGSSHENEGFTDDYDLPNDTAYAETCASIGNVMWNRRMLRLTGEGKYADVMERALYNGFLAGVSLDGKRFFYVNPLASDGKRHPLEHVSERRFTLQRREWFGTPCCPTNVARLLGSLGEYVYRIDDDEISLDLYLGSSLDATLNGSEVKIIQRTDYPWDGTVEVAVQTDRPMDLTLRPRIPGWCPEPTVTVGGETVDPGIEDGYAEIQRTWTDGDTLTIELPMPVTQIEAHPAVTAAAGRIALRRGPLIYCFEGIDTDVPLENVCIRADADFSVEYNPDLLGGVVALHGEAIRTEAGKKDSPLYRSRHSVTREMTSVTAIPYYAWAQRSRTEMRVWMRACDCTH